MIRLQFYCQYCHFDIKLDVRMLEGARLTGCVRPLKYTKLVTSVFEENEVSFIYKYT